MQKLEKAELMEIDYYYFIIKEGELHLLSFVESLELIKLNKLPTDDITNAMQQQKPLHMHSFTCNVENYHTSKLSTLSMSTVGRRRNRGPKYRAEILMRIAKVLHPASEHVMLH